MTSSPATARGPAPRFRCRACDRTLTAAQAVLEHCRDVYAARPAICRGVLEPIESGTVTQASVEAAMGRAVAGLVHEPISGDQLVAGGASCSDEGGDRVHEISIATLRAERDVNRTLSADPAGSVDFTERNHA